MIPIANLYYLLCYAWDVLPPRGVGPAVAADEEGSGAALALLTHLLTASLVRRQRRGTPGAFEAVETVGRQPRGRLLPSRLARLPRAAALGHLPSRHHQLTFDTPLHRLIVTALRRALTAEPGALPSELRRAARAALAPLASVPDLGELNQRVIADAARMLQPADTTAHLLLRASELLLLNLLPTTQPVADGSTGRRFHDFRADEVQMGRLFESFVRNFLRREQRVAAVSSDVLRWRGATATAATALPLLPVMRTDTTLTTPARRLVIDTKFYARPLAGSRFEGARLLAPHLYQLLAYLRNHSAAAGQRVEGLLLYPASAASGELALDYQLEGFRVQVRTLDLNQPWLQIRQALLDLVAD